MKPFIYLSLIFALLGCKTFTRTDFDKVEDLETTRVEFLDYPKLHWIDGDGAYYPVKFLAQPTFHWHDNGVHKKVVISYPTIYVKIPTMVLGLHNEHFFKTGEDKSCFEFPIKKLSGWVGEASYVPMERCVRSEKIPFDSAKRELQWFAKNFKWRVEWD